MSQAVPTLCIRVMQEGDLTVVHRLEREAFRKAWTIDQLRSEQRQPFTTAMVAEEAGEVVGYYFSSDVAGEASLNRIAVTKDKRHRGIGKSLLDSFLVQAQYNGSQEAFLEVNASNQKAMALYEQAGFRTVGRRRHYYAEEMADALIMRLALWKEKETERSAHADLSH